MNVSLLRLVCIGLFLFAITSVRVEAAVSPGNWQLTISNDASVLVTCTTYTGLIRNCFGVVNEFYGNRFSANAPYYFASCSASAPAPVIGASVSCSLFDKTGTQMPLTDAHLHFVVAELPPEVSTVNDYSVQDILVMGIAFLAMCAGWGVGVRLA